MRREKEILRAYNEQQTKLGNQEHTFMRGAKWADAHPHWISVVDELPKEEGWILISSGAGIDMWYYNGESAQELIDYASITHWMPLPQAPKKGVNQ